MTTWLMRGHRFGTILDEVDPWGQPLIVAPAGTVANTIEVARLAAQTAGVNPFILVSSSTVFSRDDCTEDDTTNPSTTAGWHFAVMERIVLSYPHTYVARVSGMFGDVSGGPPLRMKENRAMYLPDGLSTDIWEKSIRPEYFWSPDASLADRIIHFASKPEFWSDAITKVAPDNMQVSYKTYRGHQRTPLLKSRRSASVNLSEEISSYLQ